MGKRMDDITRFSQYLTEEKHASANTVSAYLRDIHQLWEYLREHGIDLRHADSMALQGYVGYMLSRGKAAAAGRKAPEEGSGQKGTPLSFGDSHKIPKNAVPRRGLGGEGAEEVRASGSSWKNRKCGAAWDAMPPYLGTAGGGGTALGPLHSDLVSVVYVIYLT